MKDCPKCNSNMEYFKAHLMFDGKWAYGHGCSECHYYYETWNRKKYEGGTPNDW